MWNAIKNFFQGVANAVVEAVEEIVEAIVNWFVTIVVSIAKAIFHFVKFVFFFVTLRFERAFGELFEAGRSLLEAVESIVIGGIGLILQLGAALIGFVQRLFGIETPARPLNETELGYLRPIFGESINYTKVKIIDGNIGAFTIAQAITIGNKIRISSTTLMSPITDVGNHGVMVHEVVHVWQYQNGGARYMPLALIAQNFSNTSGDWVNYPVTAVPPAAGEIATAPTGYGFESALNAGEQWDGLNTEQQATLIDAGFAMDMDFNDPGSFNFIFPRSLTDYTSQLQFAAVMLKAGRGVPIWPPTSMPLLP